MSLGQQIKKYRQALGLTLDQLSELSSVPPGTISALTVRNSVKSTYAPTLAKNGFGLSLEQFLDTETDWLPQCFDHVNANRPSGWVPTQGLLQALAADRAAQTLKNNQAQSQSTVLNTQSPAPSYGIDPIIVEATSLLNKTNKKGRELAIDYLRFIAGQHPAKEHSSGGERDSIPHQKAA